MNIAFRRFSSPWELLCSCKKETVFTAASGGVCWLKSGRGESGPQAGEALLGFSSQVCFTFWSHLAPRCWNWSHSEHWAHFLSLSIREKHCYLLVTMRKKPKEVLWSAWLASLAIPRPVTAVVVCTGCHSLTLGGLNWRIVFLTLLEARCPRSGCWQSPFLLGLLSGCVPRWPCCCACISCCLLRHQSYWVRPQPYDLI